MTEKDLTESAKDCEFCGERNLGAPAGIFEKVLPSAIFSIFSGRSEQKSGRQEVGYFSSSTKCYAGTRTV